MDIFHFHTMAVPAATQLTKTKLLAFQPPPNRNKTHVFLPPVFLPRPGSAAGFLDLADTAGFLPAFITFGDAFITFGEAFITLAFITFPEGFFMALQPDGPKGVGVAQLKPKMLCKKNVFTQKTHFFTCYHVITCVFT